MTIQERARRLAEPAAQALGLDIVEVVWTREAGERILRLTVDRPGGITHDDCEALSRRVDPAFDEEAFIEGPYRLEVSSPGAERPLQTNDDFHRFAGRRVLVRCRVPVAGRREWRGRLIGATGEAIRVATDTAEIAIPRADVARARLSID